MGFAGRGTLTATGAINLAMTSSMFAESLGAKIVRRGADWTVDATLHLADIGYYHSAGETIWKNGRPKSYTRASNDTRILAAAVIRRGILYAAFAARRDLADLALITLRAPAGYQWGADSNGIKLSARDDHDADYHPTADEIHAGRNGLAKIVTALEANQAKRAALKAQLAAERAEAQGIYVCVADSLAAGNCRAGTLAFAARHNLDPERHYSAPDILAIANGDAARVRIAIRAATLRHKREMEAGVCLLDNASV
jgi:hypothetical protein